MIYQVCDTDIKDGENQQALLHDHLKLPIGSIIRLRVKKIKKTLIGLIQDIWVKTSVQSSTNDEHTLINVIKKGDGNRA